MSIRSRSIRAVPFAFALVVSAAALAGPQDPPKTITEKIKEKAGSAATSIKKGASNANEAIREKFEQARAGVSKMGIESRVYARLHWEKALADAKIDLGAPTEGVITLTGVVADEKARAKALELTRDTVGVTQAVDRLTVRTSTEGAVPVKP
jgi:osmotically-inducible protein OsmY